MYHKKITYVDYNGVERTEDHYFNLSKAEVMKMEMGIDGGYAEYLNKITKANNEPALMDVFSKIIHKAYGEKSLDGRKFIKSEELSTAFEQTEAYSELFMELITNADAAAEFVKGILPSDLNEYVKSVAPAAE